MKRILLITILCSSLGYAQKQAETLFEQALMKERSQGDLKGAIALYQRIAADKNTSRAMAAKALLEMARCQEKEGGENARRTYERLVKDFADQPEAVAAARTRMSVLGAASGPRLRQLWAGGGEVHDEGSISLDGRYLTYTSWEAGDLAVRDLVANTSRLLTHNGPEEVQRLTRVQQSRFSPDGSQIAYTWFQLRSRGGELRVVNSDGAGVRTVAWQGFTASNLALMGWSPDGKQVAVAEYGRDNQCAVFLIAVATGEKREIMKPGRWNVNGGGRTFSPDGKWIAFTHIERGNGDIYLLPASGGDARPLVTHAANDRDPFFAADGKSVYFLSDRTGTISIWCIPVNDGKPAGPPVLVRRELSNAVKAIGLTSNGSLVFTTNVGAADIYSVPFDFTAGKMTGAPQVFSSQHPSGNTEPNLSADGKRMVWHTIDPVSGRGPQYAVLRDMTTGEEKNFQVPSASVPFLAPGTERILLDTPGNNSRNLLWLDPRTGGTELLLNIASTGWHVSPAFSRDGKTLFYISRDSQSRTMAVQAMDLATRTPRQVAQGTEFQGLTLSPDGRFLATERSSGDRRREVLLIPLEGGPPRVVSSIESRLFINGRPSFTPDGKTIYTSRVTTTTPIRSELVKVDIATGKVESTGLLMKGMVFPQLDPARGKIYVQSGLRELEIWSAEGLLSAR
ncbi:MAG: PD40 domain-containing protein [Acidobacteria bacterium]|nr:PD40 domain-containing protein [Acidobacteriota bacterium]